MSVFWSHERRVDGDYGKRRSTDEPTRANKSNAVNPEPHESFYDGVSVRRLLIAPSALEFSVVLA